MFLKKARHEIGEIRIGNLFVSMSLLEGKLQKTYIMSEGTANRHMLQKKLLQLYCSK